MQLVVARGFVKTVRRSPMQVRTVRAARRLALATLVALAGPADLWLLHEGVPLGSVDASTSGTASAPYVTHATEDCPEHLHATRHDPRHCPCPEHHRSPWHRHARAHDCSLASMLVGRAAVVDALVAAMRAVRPHLPHDDVVLTRIVGRTASGLAPPA